MTRYSCVRLTRIVLLMLLAALMSSACAQGTKDPRAVPFQVTFEPGGKVVVKSPEGKPLPEVKINFPFQFPEKTTGVEMYNFNAFRFAGSSYMIFCYAPGYCVCIDLPQPPNGQIGNACSTLH
jgi:hypothetical protein